MEALCIMDTGILTPFSDESMAHGPFMRTRPLYLVRYVNYVMDEFGSNKRLGCHWILSGSSPTTPTPLPRSSLEALSSD